MEKLAFLKQKRSLMICGGRRISFGRSSFSFWKYPGNKEIFYYQFTIINLTLKNNIMILISITLRSIKYFFSVEIFSQKWWRKIYFPFFSSKFNLSEYTTFSPSPPPIFQKIASSIIRLSIFFERKHKLTLNICLPQSDPTPLPVSSNFKPIVAQFHERYICIYSWKYFSHKQRIIMPTRFLARCSKWIVLSLSLSLHVASHCPWIIVKVSRIRKRTTASMNSRRETFDRRS